MVVRLELRPGRFACKCRCFMGRLAFAVSVTLMMLVASQVQGQQSCKANSDCNLYSPNNLGKCTRRSGGQMNCNCTLATRKFGDICQSSCNITDERAVCGNGICEEEVDPLFGYVIRQCACDKNWDKDSNDLCRVALCSPSCLNGGVCVRPNQCQCAAGFMGAQCNETSPRKCDNLQPPLNGRVVIGEQQGRQQLSFECDSGYIASGHTVLLCDEGRWSSSPPTCIDADECAHKFHNCGKKCMTCKNLVGSFSCVQTPGMENFVFSSSTGRCHPNDQRSCDAQLSVTAGNISYWPDERSDKKRNGTEARLVCHRGYQALDKARKLAICVDGSWNLRLSGCAKACKPISFEQGSLVEYVPAIPKSITIDIPAGTAAKLRCVNQTRPLYRSRAIVYCTDGRWSRELSICIGAAGKSSSAPSTASSSDDATAIIVPVVILGILLPALIVLFVVYYRSRAPDYKYSVSVEIRTSVLDQEDVKPLPSALTYEAPETVDGNTAKPNCINVHYASREVAMGGKSPKPNPSVVAALTQAPVPKSDTLERPSLTPAPEETAPTTHHGYAAVSVHKKKDKSEAKKKAMKPPPKTISRVQQKQDEVEEYDDVARQKKDAASPPITATRSNSPPQTTQADVTVHAPSAKKALVPKKITPSPSPPIDEHEYDVPSANADAPVKVPCRTVSMPTSTSLRESQRTGQTS